VTPTARSLRLLRREGFAVAVVERWLPKINRRSDCFGFADLLACRPRDRQILLVQTTSLSNLSARIRKAKALQMLETWLLAGGKVEFHGWTKKGERWECKRVTLCPSDLSPVVLTAPRRRRASRYRQPDLFERS
jgi:hypothetical protein